MKISTNWLRDFVELAPPIVRVSDHLTMAGLEVKKVESLSDISDTLFETEITSNRPDWLSHLGVAREIAAIENLSLKMPHLDIEANRTPPPGWKINIKDAEGCPYYTGVLIEGITQTKTPDFMIQRLLACGIRSINLIVDITNYVLLEYGQPLHAFDADLIQGKEIQVRKAKPGEKLFAINGTTLDLSPGDLVIADSDYAVALAGVIGGKKSEINDRSRNVFLESAFFDPGKVRRTSRRHQITSDSSYRFERRVDPEAVDFGRQRALALIKQYAKPRYISSAVKAGEKPRLLAPTLHLRDSEVRDTLGCEIKSNQIVSILTRLGCDVKQHAAGSWKVGIPSYRPDLERPVDLVEEIARIYGYDAIPETLPARPPVFVGENPRLKLERRLRRFLSGAGFHEAITFSLISEQGLDVECDLKAAVRIINPLQQGLHWMRPTMVTSLLNVVRKNVNAGADSVALFEIANLYSMSDALKHPVEERVCAIALSGKKSAQTWCDTARPVSFYDLKGCVESLLAFSGCPELCVAKVAKSYFAADRSEEIRIWQTSVAVSGEISDSLLRQWDLQEPVFYAEILLDKLLASSSTDRIFREWPKYPAVERDLSLTVKEDVQCGALMQEIRGLGEDLIREVRLFDFFRGKRVPEGCKNLAFRILYQSLEKTLVSDDVQKLHDRIAETLVKKYRATFQ